MNFGLRLKALLAEKKISQSEMSRQLGLTRTAVSQWILGKAKPQHEALLKIASILDIPITRLVENDSDVPAGWVKVPVIGDVPAGIPIEAVEEFVDEMLVPAHEYKPDRMFGLQVVGDSMEPTFKNGDSVLVDRGAEVVNNDVVVCRVNCYGEVTLKRYFKKDNSIILRPDNNKYEPIVIPLKELGFEEPSETHVIGKVKLLIRKSF